MQIRDTRNGEWHWVSNNVLACLSISASDKAVYSALSTFSGYSEIRPTFKTLAERCGVSVRTAKESIKNLEGAGFIEIKNHGKKKTANVYFLCKVLEGCIYKCKSCTIHKKKCSSRTLKVQTAHSISANPAPHIDNIDNKYIRPDFSKKAEKPKDNLKTLQERYPELATKGAKKI